MKSYSFDEARKRPYDQNVVREYYIDQIPPLRRHTTVAQRPSTTSGLLLLRTCTISCSGASREGKQSVSEILIVDPDPFTVKLLQFVLEQASHTQRSAGDADAALALIQQRTPDLVLIEINLPKMTGFELCREIRRTSDVPIIFVTTRSTLHDRVTGLQIGGDDYIQKPFDAVELLARTSAVLRRCADWKERAASQATFEDLTLNLIEQRIARGDEPGCALTLLEFRLMHYLMQNVGRTLSCDQILAAVWEASSGSNRNLVAVYVRRLRSKLAQIGANPGMIESVANLGYRLAPSAAVERVPGAPDEHEYLEIAPSTAAWAESLVYGS
jgi:DNA-binding response OmpR family regulator